MWLSLFTITQYEFTLVAFRQKLDKGGGRRRGEGEKGERKFLPLSPLPLPFLQLLSERLLGEIPEKLKSVSLG